MQLRISSAPGTAAVCPGIATHTLASGAARSRMRLVRQYSPLPCGPGRGSTVGSRGAGEGGVATVVIICQTGVMRPRNAWQSSPPPLHPPTTTPPLQFCTSPSTTRALTGGRRARLTRPIRRLTSHRHRHGSAIRRTDPYRGTALSSMPAGRATGLSRRAPGGHLGAPTRAARAPSCWHRLRGGKWTGATCRWRYSCPYPCPCPCPCP